MRYLKPSAFGGHAALTRNLGLDLKGQSWTNSKNLRWVSFSSNINKSDFNIDRDKKIKTLDMHYFNLEETKD